MNLFTRMSRLFDPQKDVQTKKVKPAQTSVGPSKPALPSVETLEHMLNRYRLVLPGSADELVLMQKIERNAVSFDDWCDVLDSTSPSTSLGKRAVERLPALASGKDEWEKLMQYAVQDSELGILRDHCLERMGSDLAGLSSVDEIVSFYDELSSTSPLKAVAVERLKNTSATFSDWVSAYADRSDLDEFSDVLLTKAIGLALTPYDWDHLWELAENNHDDDLRQVREALERVSWSPDSWEELRDITSSDSALETFAFKKMAAATRSVVEHIKFYLDCVENWTLDSEVTDAILEQIFAKASREQIELIALLAEDDDLRSEAEKRLEQ